MFSKRLRMCLRTISCSVSWRRASGELDFGCFGTRAARFDRFERRQFNNVVHLHNNVIKSVSKRKMLSTFEENVLRSKRQQHQTQQNLCNSTLKNSTNHYRNCRHKGVQNKHEQDIELEYEEAVRTLNTLQSNADTLRRSISSIIKPNSLADMPKFLERSGITLADLDEQSFIHVSGTKGKGSTCALTDSILRVYGVRTGFFSSPHLISVTERIRLNGEPIDKEKFTRAFWCIYNRLQAAQDSPTDMPAYFKFLTLLAFHIFIKEKVDVMILEVGIGGELDCTNILRNTKTIGISSLGLEHTQLLGETLKEIAWQKAGIIKPNSHVYTSVTQPECLEVIKKRVLKKNATLHVVPSFAEYCKDPNYKDFLLNLNNVTQLNGSLAIQLAYDWLRQHKKGFKQDFAFNETRLTKSVVNGLIDCNWPGRCQKINYMNFDVHLDGAHTIESMHVCGEWFAKVTKESSSPKVLIFNSTGDRNSRKLLEILRGYSNFDLVCFVPNIVDGNVGNRSDMHSVIDHAEQLKRTKVHADNWKILCSEENDVDNSHVFESILESLHYICKMYGSERQLDVLITGSLHLIGASISALNNFKKNSGDSL